MSERVIGLPPISSSSAMTRRFLRGLKLGVDADRHDAVVALEPLGRGRHRLLGGREERVHPDAQPVAARPPSRVPEALGREERGRGERMRRGEREIREAREAGLDAVHDVEVARAAARAGGSPGRRPAPPRCVRREIGIDGPTAITSRSMPRWSARRPSRRSRAREDGASTVTSCPSRRSACGRPVHVHVHLVWLRPRERRDEADPEARRQGARAWRGGRHITARTNGAYTIVGRMRRRSRPSSARSRSSQALTAAASERWPAPRRPEPEESTEAVTAQPVRGRLPFFARRAFLTMKRSICSCASSSRICFGGDFMR